MQTLYIPDVIHIDFIDKTGNTFQQENILIGIHTFATHRNDVNLFPFITNKDGHIIITKEHLQKRAEIVYRYGMDYDLIETAKPEIQIYFWGNESINRYIGYWKMTLRKQEERRSKEPDNFIDKFIIEQEKQSPEKFAAIEKRWREDLHIFETCFNRKTKQTEDIILVTDIWDKPNTEKNYEIVLSV